MLIMFFLKNVALLPTRRRNFSRWDDRNGIARSRSKRYEKNRNATSRRFRSRTTSRVDHRRARRRNSRSGEFLRDARHPHGAGLGSALHPARDAGISAARSRLHRARRLHFALALAAKLHPLRDPPSPTLGYFLRATAQDPRPLIVHEGIPGPLLSTLSFLETRRPDPASLLRLGRERRHRLLR